MNIKNQLKSVAIKAATEAGKLLMENIDVLKSAEIQSDAYANPTTKIDSQSERKIVEIIKSVFPEHAFLGEELGKIESDSQYKWIIDPIDGTNNYVAKRDTFSVSIGLEHQGEIILGVIYLPKIDEIFVAEKNNGATLNGKAIHISGANDLAKAVVTYSTYPGTEKLKAADFDKKILEAIPQVKFFGFGDNGAVD